MMISQRSRGIEKSYPKIQIVPLGSELEGGSRQQAGSRGLSNIPEGFERNLRRPNGTNRPHSRLRRRSQIRKLPRTKIEKYFNEYRDFRRFKDRPRRQKISPVSHPESRSRSNRTMLRRLKSPAVRLFFGGFYRLHRCYFCGLNGGMHPGHGPSPAGEKETRAPWKRFFLVRFSRSQSWSLGKFPVGSHNRA